MVIENLKENLCELCSLAADSYRPLREKIDINIISPPFGIATPLFQFAERWIR